MDLWLIIPVKSLTQGKSRLAAALSPAERQHLSRRLLEQTLSTVSNVDELAGVLVISPDEEAQAIARAAGATVLPETLQSGTAASNSEPNLHLNRALGLARDAAVDRHADAILVLPTDLPLLTVEEVHNVCQIGKRLDRGIAIAGSQDGGTNALFLTPPDIIEFAYGPDSFHRHVYQAQRAGLPVQVIYSPALALDLDLPQDLHRWHAIQQS